MMNEEGEYYYILYQISPTGKLCREGEMDCKKDAEIWVQEGIEHGR